jgi:hypothetical protein
MPSASSASNLLLLTRTNSAERWDTTDMGVPAMCHKNDSLDSK